MSKNFSPILISIFYKNWAKYMGTSVVYGNYCLTHENDAMIISIYIKEFRPGIVPGRRRRRQAKTLVTYKMFCFD